MNYLVPLLYEALAADYGIVVVTNNPEQLRAKLYPLRKQDPDLEVLSFVISPANPAAELWIVKRGPDEG